MGKRNHTMKVKSKELMRNYKGDGKNDKSYLQRLITYVNLTFSTLKRK